MDVWLLKAKACITSVIVFAVSDVIYLFTLSPEEAIAAKRWVNMKIKIELHYCYVLVLNYV